MCREPNKRKYKGGHTIGNSIVLMGVLKEKRCNGLHGLKVGNDLECDGSVRNVWFKKMNYPVLIILID